MCPHTSLTDKRLLGVSVKAYSAWKKGFCNLFDHIKMGSRFVCCDNVCWARGSQTVSHSGLLDVCEAIDKMSASLYKQRTLPRPGTVKESARAGLGKHHAYGIFLPRS